MVLRSASPSAGKPAKVVADWRQRFPGRRHRGVADHWIAFSAAHATELEQRYRLSAQETFREFLPKLLALHTPGRFEAASKAALQALARCETVTVLAIVPSRVLTLRNQLMRGGVVTSSTPA